MMDEHYGYPRLPFLIGYPTLIKEGDRTMGEPERETRLTCRENPANDSMIYSLTGKPGTGSGYEPVCQLEVEAYFGKRDVGTVDIGQRDKNNQYTGDSVTIEGRYLLPLITILRKSYDHYTRKDADMERRTASEMNRESRIVDSQHIVNQAPVEDSLSQKAVYRFYKSPEDEKAENPFVELYVFQDNDICIRDHTKKEIDEVVIPDRFVEEFIDCIRANRRVEMTTTDASTGDYSSQFTAAAADGEDKKIEALATMTAAYVTSNSACSPGTIEDVMAAFRGMLGLPPILVVKKNDGTD